MKRLTLFLCLPVLGLAVNYYVSPRGDDRYNGRSWDSAFATTQRAANVVASGDSVYVANGDYAGFDLRRGGTQNAPVVFKAYGDSARIITRNNVTPDGINIENADWIVVDGFKVVAIDRAGIRAALAQHVTIRNNVCDRNVRWGIFTGFADYALIERNECRYSQQEHGIYFSNSADHPVIRKNICHHNNANGIHMNGDSAMGGDGLITDATVEGNIVYENGVGGGSGINCDGVAESRFFNNLLYMNHASGISLYKIDASAGSYKNRVYNNTIVNASNGRWCININSGSWGDTLFNNCLINLHPTRGSVSIDSLSRPAFFSDYNVVINRMSTNGGNTVISLATWQALGYDRRSQLAGALDSIFRDWSAGDYHLRARSLAIDTGTVRVSGIVRYDLDSLARPQGAAFDVGAYEYLPTRIEESESVVARKNAACVVSRNGSVVYFHGLVAGARVTVYAADGRLVEALNYSHGHTVRWVTRTVPSGVYFYLIRQPDQLDESRRGAISRRDKIILCR